MHHTLYKAAGLLILKLYKHAKICTEVNEFTSKHRILKNHGI